MTLKEMYQFIIQKGIEKDPRGETIVKKRLHEEKEKYDKLSSEEKAFFDIERLSNPYTDTRILYGSPDRVIESILVGIDIETPELLLADSLRRGGKRIDLVLAHHPEGRAYATFYEVMNMHTDILYQLGVPVNIAEAITEPRIKEVSRKTLPRNHTRTVDASRLLDIPLMSCHTPADNFVTNYLQELFDKKKPDYIDEVVEILRSIPEYKESIKKSRGPVIFVGAKEKRTGKIFVDMTGGTEGSVEALEKLSQSGIGTIVGMHMSEEHYKNAEKYHINVVIAGHISSDTLGLNLLLDTVETQFHKLEFIECSGFTRISRCQ